MSNPMYDSLFGIHGNNHATFLSLTNGTTLSYDAFIRLASRFANAIVDIGLEPGDRLAMQVAKSPEALAVYAACVQTGVVILPLNTAYTVNEVEYFVKNSRARLLVCDGNAEASLAPIAERHGATLTTLNRDGSGMLRDLADQKASIFDTIHRRNDDLVALLYTSGTTGRSKGAMLTQINLMSNARRLAEHWRFSADDVLLHALPIFHTHGLFVATNVTLVSGSSMMFLPGFDVDQVMTCMKDTTVMMGVPTFYSRLLADTRLGIDTASHMRLFVSGSAPLLAETHGEFEQRAGHRILERYGMTETNMIASNPYDGERRAGTVGFALPEVEIRIRNKDSGESVDTGEVGMIQVRGPNVFSGYWEMPDRTREEFTNDGFFITGDLGMFDNDGYLHIVGRDKDLVISGGFNVYPKEVEQILDEQEGIVESAVIGVPHPDFGEGVVGILACEPDSRIDLQSVTISVAGRLANFKRPKKLVIVDEFPRNTMGKVQKNILRERFQNVFHERGD